MIALQTTDTVTLPFGTSALEALLTEVLGDHGVSSDLSVVVSNDAHLHELNLEYRQVDRPTDVLSFQLDDPHHPGLDTLGEVYISIETAERQAADAGHTLEAEITHLAIHGVLHLLGYEHDTDPGHEKMRSREDEYLQTAGSLHQPSLMASGQPKGA